MSKLQILNISTTDFMIGETDLGLLYRPKGLERDCKHGRWTIKLSGITVEFKDANPTIFGKLKSLAAAYLFVMENGEDEMLPPVLKDKYDKTGLLGMYRRGGLKAHYHVRIYGDIVDVPIDTKKNDNREFTTASRIQGKLMKTVPKELLYSFEKLNPFI